MWDVCNVKIVLAKESDSTPRRKVQPAHDPAEAKKENFIAKRNGSSHEKKWPWKVASRDGKCEFDLEKLGGQF